MAFPLSSLSICESLSCSQLLLTFGSEDTISLTWWFVSFLVIVKEGFQLFMKYFIFCILNLHSVPVMGAIRVLLLLY